MNLHFSVLRKIYKNCCIQSFFWLQRLHRFQNFKCPARDTQMKNINVCKVKMVVDHELIELFAHFLLPLELYCKSYWYYLRWQLQQYTALATIPQDGATSTIVATRYLLSTATGYSNMQLLHDQFHNSSIQYCFGYLLNHTERLLDS